MMKKNYIKPASKRIVLSLENIMAAQSIQQGTGEGDHEASTKKNRFIFDDETEPATE